MDTPKVKINVDDIDLKSDNVEENDTVQETSGFQNETTRTANTDENDITIADKQSPIVMLFGPRSSGKSMTLVRLSRYLHDCGYTVKADKTFKSGPEYKEKCEAFMKNIDTKEALPGNAYTDFMLVKIMVTF